MKFDIKRTCLVLFIAPFQECGAAHKRPISGGVTIIISKSCDARAVFVQSSLAHQKQTIWTYFLWCKPSSITITSESQNISVVFSLVCVYCFLTFMFFYIYAMVYWEFICRELEISVFENEMIYACHYINFMKWIWYDRRIMLLLLRCNVFAYRFQLFWVKYERTILFCDSAGRFGVHVFGILNGNYQQQQKS